MSPPVALFIHRRPDATARVVAEIARARPRRLLVIADGPRDPSQAAACAAARRIAESVTWECDLLTNYADANMGCGRRMTSGLAWVFEQCDRAIVLEDDCVPHSSFFRYCGELLDRYRNDDRVMTIGGSTFQDGRRRGSASYFFARNMHLWGWATWRRAWTAYDPAMTEWPALRRSRWLDGWLSDPVAAEYWRVKFDGVHRRAAHYWDYQWVFSCWARRGLAVTPNVNLVSNIGFGSTGTHTTDSRSRYANAPTQAIAFPLAHPATVAPDDDADRFSHDQRISGRLYYRLRRIARSLG